MKILFLFLLSAGMLLASNGCNQSRKAADDGNLKQSSGKTNMYQSLSDYLRRDPKVRISGSGENLVVYIRSADTMSGDFEPLFVIDGSVYANSYTEASRLVMAEDIKSVRVLNANEGSAQYGIRGNNGVVIIKTKGNK